MREDQTKHNIKTHHNTKAHSATETIKNTTRNGNFQKGIKERITSQGTTSIASIKIKEID